MVKKVLPYCPIWHNGMPDITMHQPVNIRIERGQYSIAMLTRILINDML
jgi:hypothetical protein